MYILHIMIRIKVVKTTKTNSYIIFAYDRHVCNDLSKKYSCCVTYWNKLFQFNFCITSYFEQR